MGIRFKLIAPAIVALSLVAGIIYLFWLPAFVEAERADIEEQHHNEIELLAIALTGPLLQNDLGEIYAVVETVAVHHQNWRLLSIFDSEGGRIYPMFPEEAGDDEALLQIATEIKSLDRKLGKIELSLDVTSILAEKQARLNQAALFIFGLLALSLLVSTVLQDIWVTTPLKRLAAATRRINSGDFDSSLPAVTNDEMGQLTKSFEIMRLGLAQSQRELRNEIDVAREAMRALDASEQHLHAVLDNIPEGVVTMDDEGVIDSVNSTLCSILGYQQDELLGTRMMDLIPAAQGEDHIAFFRRYHSLQNENAGGLLPRETLALSSGGDLVPVEIVINLMTNGDKCYVVAIIRDVSEIRRVAKEKEQLMHQLQQSQKMEAIGQLTGGIAHDFNNILASMMGYTELALEKFGQDESDKLTRYLKEIHGAGGKARDLVGQMLAFSRDDDGEVREINPIPVLKEAARMLHATIPSSIELSMVLPNEIPAIKVDPVQLHQVVMNLVINSRDAMAGKGEIEVRLQVSSEGEGVCDSCHDRYTGEFVELLVTDTGKGIPREVIERMFNPFYTTKAVGKGTGMGLSMVHGIVHACGGHIRVDSTLGEGTQIHILIPAASEAALDPFDSEQQLRQRAAESRTGRILVVDDDSSVGAFIGELLDSRGYQVKVLTDSVQALKQIQEQPDAYELLITDQTMPRLTGAELAQGAMAANPGLPVIICSGFSDQIDAAGAEAIGVRYYLAKPIDMDQLLDAANELLKPSSADSDASRTA